MKESALFAVYGLDFRVHSGLREQIADNELWGLGCVFLGIRMFVKGLGLMRVRVYGSCDLGFTAHAGVQGSNLESVYRMKDSARQPACAAQQVCLDFVSNGLCESAGLQVFRIRTVWGVLVRV